MVRTPLPWFPMKEAAAPGAARTKPDAVAAGKMPRRNKHGIKQGSHRDDACAERDQKSYAEFLVVHFMGWGRADDRHQGPRKPETGMGFLNPSEARIQHPARRRRSKF